MMMKKSISRGTIATIRQWKIKRGGHGFDWSMWVKWSLFIIRRWEHAFFGDYLGN